MINFTMHHIGVVVRDIKKGIKEQTEQYGYRKETEIIYVENQGVNVILLKQNSSNVFLELVEPINEKSPAYNALKMGGGLDHRCYETDDFLRTLDKFKNKIVRSPRPSPMELFQGRKTFFIYRNHQLIEFLEK